MKENTITLKTASPAYGGISIARLDGKVVMVSGAIPGETVAVRVDEEKKDYLKASVVEVIEPSPDRVNPPCQYFSTCGGCQLQYISYPSQVRLKEEVLRESVRRIAGHDICLSGPLTGEPWHYRHRAQFKAAGGKVGFFKERTREVVDIDSCPLMVSGINEGLKKARGLLSGTDITGLDLAYGDGLVALVKARPGSKSGWDRVGNTFLNNGFLGVVVQIDGGKTLKYGRVYTTLDMDGLTYTVSPMSFFQAHWGLNLEVVRTVIDNLRPLEGKSVLDLYSGAGNFSLPISLHAEKVSAVEEAPSAVADGNRNLRLNRIKNCSFIRSGADSLRAEGPVDILVVDPPRQGIGDAAMNRLIDIAPVRIAYVSCNPSTFARDLKKLIDRYEVESVRMIDFFPQTYHIESLAFFRLTNP